MKALIFIINNLLGLPMFYLAYLGMESFGFGHITTILTLVVVSFLYDIKVSEG